MCNEVNVYELNFSNENYGKKLRSLLTNKSKDQQRFFR